MAKYIDGNLIFPATIKVERTAPLDDRLVVETIADLTNGTIDYPYEGMVVNVRESGVDNERHTEDLYVLVGLPATNPDNWKRIKGADEIDQDNDEIYTTIKGVQTELHDRIDAEILQILEDPAGTQALDSFKEVVEWCEGHLKDVEDLKDMTNKGLQAAFNTVKERIDGLQTELEKTDADIKKDIEEKWTEINDKVDGLNDFTNTRIDNLDKKVDTHVTEIYQKIQEEHKEHAETESKQDDQIRDLYVKLGDEITNREDVDNKIWEAIVNEVLTREEEDAKLNQLVWEKYEDRVREDNRLQGEINKKEVESIERDQAIQADLEAKYADRVAEDIRLQEEINKKEVESIERDQAIQADLDDKYLDRVLEDQRLQDEINKKEVESIERDQAIQADLEAKYADRVNKDEELLQLINQRELESVIRDQELDRKINSERTALDIIIAGVQSRITRERIELDARDNDLQRQIDEHLIDFAGQQSRLDLRITDVDNRAQLRDEDILNQLKGEQAARIAGDNQLHIELESEQATRIAQDELIREDLATEKKQREDQDVILTQAILDEEARAKGVESTLQGNITTETNARIAQDDILKKNIDDDKQYLLDQIDNLKNLIFGGEDIAGQFDTIKEIADWIVTHKGEYSELLEYVKNLKIDEANARQESDARLEGLINAERLAREAKDADLALEIKRVEDERIAKDAELAGKITEEANARATGDAALDTKLNTEIATRDTADKELSEFINNVKNASELKDNELETYIKSVEQSSQSADADLQSQITAEKEARILADQGFNSAIQQEKDARTQSDVDLYNKIESSYNELMKLYTNLKNDLLGVTEIRDDEDMDKILESIIEIPLFIQSHRIEYANLKEFIEKFKESEENARQEGNSQLQSALEAEAATREQVDTELSNSLSAETLARESADITLQTNINNEASARESADITLQTNINIEKKRAEDAEYALRVDLNTEKQAREDADAQLREDLDAEIKAREDADTAIHTRITNVEEKYDLHIKEAKMYVPEIVEDHWVTEEIGDIPTGLHKDDELISEHSINYILDKLLYKTMQPTVVEPSIFMTYEGAELFEVGATLPADSDFVKGYDRGSVSYENANGDKYYAGTATESLTISKENFGETATEGIYEVVYSVNFGEGADLKNNKGEDSTVAKYAGGELKMTKELHVCLPIYANTNQINTVVAQEVVDYFVDGAEVIVNIPMETSANKFELHVPSHLEFSCHQYIPTGSYTDAIKLVAMGTVMHNGVEYAKYARTSYANSIQSASKYKIVIGKTDDVDTPIDPNPGEESTTIYKKITNVSELTDGDYLIVCEDESLAFNGGITDKLDVISNFITVAIDEDEIPSNVVNDAAAFAYNSVEHTFKSTTYKFIGQTTDTNGLKEDKPYDNTVTFDDEGNVNIVSGGAYLRFNATTGQMRFRYYQSGTYTLQKPVQLYKRVAVSVDDGGSETPPPIS